MLFFFKKKNKYQLIISFIFFFLKKKKKKKVKTLRPLLEIVIIVFLHIKFKLFIYVNYKNIS